MNKREAQMPPMPPMGDPMGGPPPPGVPPGGPPGGPPPPERPPIPGPLDSVGKLLYDFDIEKEIATNPNRSEEDLALKVWTDYGGSEDGGVVDGHVGDRDESDAQRDQQEVTEVNEKTEGSKWVRLPRGQHISDVTSLDELKGMMKDLMYGTIKKFKAPAAPPGGGGPPGMPPMASRSDGSIMIRTSELSDMAQAVDRVRKKARG